LSSFLLIEWYGWLVIVVDLDHQQTLPLHARHELEFWNLECDDIYTTQRLCNPIIYNSYTAL